MKTFAITALLALGSSISASPLNARAEEDLGFEPGIKIPTVCFGTPHANVCPAMPPSGNLLVTSRNVVIDESQPDVVTKKPSNILRAGYNRKDGKLLEESTLAIFNFPPGFENKNCTFHFISDSGDLEEEDLYAVWQLENGGTSADYATTTWNKRPKRVQVLATLTTSKSERSSFATRKTGHEFLQGPGYMRAPNTLNGVPTNRFNCPKGGKIVWEFAALLKKQPKEGIINVGGHSGLAVEIVDETPVPWFGFGSAIRGNRS